MTMPCELVFNELSIEPAASNIAEARERIRSLLGLLIAASRRCGVRHLRIDREFFAREIGPGYPIRRWLNDDRVDKEERRRLKAFAQGRSYVDRQDPPEILARWQQAVAWLDETTRAHGLFAAFLLDSFAVSLPSGARWREALLVLRILHPDPDGELVDLEAQSL